MMKHSEDFKREAVRIALTSGLSRSGLPRFGGRQVDAWQMDCSLSAD
jgi:transposase-like protein